MLIIDDISVSYRLKGKKLPVLSHFSLKLQKGEVLAVLGPSGCGKSTLIQALAGMLPLDEGRVVMENGRRQVPLHPKTQTISVIPQNGGLLPWKTVRQNCLLPLRLKHREISAAILAELLETCQALQVDALLDRYPGKLSGGQKQRAALARAFLQDPDLLLMDEPFSSLDVITRTDAWELFLKTWAKKKPATLLVTHNIEEALYLGQQIAVLDKDKGQLLTMLYNPHFAKAETNHKDADAIRQQLHSMLKPSDAGETP